MKCIWSTLSLLLFLGSLITTFAQTTKTGSLSGVAFMEGHWRGNFNGGPIEAAWIAAVGDNLTGLCG